MPRHGWFGFVLAADSVGAARCPVFTCIDAHRANSTAVAACLRSACYARPADQRSAIAQTSASCRSTVLPLVLLAGWEVITEKVPQYFAAFLILSGLMVGVFGVTDGLAC